MPLIHKMKLHDQPFAATKAGKKTIEIRLFDSKRRKIRIGDIIEFKKSGTLEILKTKVKDLRKYSTLEKLVQAESFEKTGGIYIHREDWIKSINSYYTVEDQFNLGLVAIEILLCS